MEKDVGKDLKTLLNELRQLKTPRSVISKRLEAGRTIQLDLKTKASLLTIISGNETPDTQSHSLIIAEGRTPRIVCIADRFVPEVSIYVLTVEKGSELPQNMISPY